MAAKIQYLLKIKITIVKNSNTYKKLIETYNVTVSIYMCGLYK
jgi:hypothetical protein